MTTDATPALRLAGISKSFGHITALSGVDLEVRAGEVLALLGDNGAGKSTLVKITSGLYQPDEGEIEVNGAARRFATPADARSEERRVGKECW